MKKFIYILFVAFILPGCSTSNSVEAQPSSDPSSATVDAVKNQDDKTPPADAQNEKKEVNREECNKVAIGMTTDEVKALLGEPASNTEHESVNGKMETWSYQRQVYFGANCMIIFQDGKVLSKTFMDL